MRYYVFPKFFQEFTVEELMEQCAEAGLDGPTALVREGYWLEEANLSRSLPLYIDAAQKRGLEVCFADTSYQMEDLADDDTPLRVLADNGILALRLGYVAQSKVSPRELCDYTRRLVEKVAVASQRCGVRALLHLHGGFYPHNATAAYPLVAGLDPAGVGVLLDPGNNVQQEGTENLPYQTALLGEYLGGLGLKDSRPHRLKDFQNDTRKGWRREWSPAFEGEVDWHEVFASLQRQRCDGPIVFQPFYDTDNQQRFLLNFQREVAYIKQIAKELIL